jgi:YebC/PmpR family DNA-binding regulatory protein
MLHWMHGFLAFHRRVGPKPVRTQIKEEDGSCYNLCSPAGISGTEAVYVSLAQAGPEQRNQRNPSLKARGIPMSGHSKWATIKHKKGALDAKRGKIFTRLIKEIAIAAKAGGDPDTNPRLRTAIAAAKAENMPADNIKRAIQRGTGELPGATYEEFMLEGYGPGGVAILLDINTDNRNRTVSEIRHAFGKNGGNMASAGAVAYLFHKKGDIVIAKTAAKEDDLMGIVLEAGADDLKDDGENWEVITDPSAFEAVVEAVKKAGIQPISAAVSMVPQNYIKLEGAQASTMVRLLEALEEHDDVQNVHANFDIDQKLLEEVAAS